MSAPVDVWVGYPRSYTKGRARAPQYVTLHYTAGSEGSTSAENGAAYDKTRTDGTSCHVFVDSSGLPCREVPDGDRAHCAFWHGNEIGIHIELCGTRQTRAQWLDKTSMAMLEYAAALVADICKRHGFKVKRLSVAETRAAYYNPASSRPTGINDHYTITQAYPEDNGDHTDVGADFPWDVFMDLVEGAGDVALTQDDLNKVAEAVWNRMITSEALGNRKADQFQKGGIAAESAINDKVMPALAEMQTQLDALADQVGEALAALDGDVNESVARALRTGADALEPQS
jgi:N-acetyl-anhydromuramyl-L-alanine amidase AmpD